VKWKESCTICQLLQCAYLKLIGVQHLTLFPTGWQAFGTKRHNGSQQYCKTFGKYHDGSAHATFAYTFKKNPCGYMQKKKPLTRQKEKQNYNRCSPSTLAVAACIHMSSVLSTYKPRPCSLSVKQSSVCATAWLPDSEKDCTALLAGFAARACWKGVVLFKGPCKFYCGYSDSLPAYNLSNSSSA